MPKTVRDICSIVFNDGESYADKKHFINELKKSDQFTYYAPINTKAGKKDFKIYLYCEGNPQDVYKQIEISLPYRVIDIDYAKNLTFNNLEMLYGLAPLAGAWNETITMSYCIGGWSGGAWVESKVYVRYYGGLGEWEWSTNTLYDHCYIYQQFDSGVTPQYAGSNEGAIFKNYVTKDCLFENCEYTLEYFLDCTKTTDEKFDGLYFGYNFCRLGGNGFGNKPTKSAYVKSWAHENNCYNSAIEYNVFDRHFA